MAFSSTAANLVPGDTNGVAEIFVRDRLSGTTERISVDGPGVQGNGDSTVPVTNADGRFVAFESIATNLVSGDTNGLRDIFLHDRVTGTTVRASIAGDGSQALGGNSYQPDITAGGTVAFQSLANNLVAGDANDAMDVFVRTLSDTDSDGDDWSDQAEATIGTNPTSACGVDAWPADINNDGFSDGTDITIVAGSFGKAVPPAPTS